MRKSVLFFLWHIIVLSAAAQNLPRTDSLLPEINSKYVINLQKRITRYGQQINQLSDKAMARMDKAERKMLRILQKADSNAAHNLFKELALQKSGLQEISKQTTKQSSGIPYLPGLDSINATLSLYFDKSVTSQLKLPEGDLKKALASVDELKQALQKAGNFKESLRNRRELLRTYADRFGLAKRFSRYNKKVYYYSEQVRELYSDWKDPQKRDQRILGLISQLPVFKDFFSKHSELAALFPVPANYGSPLALQGLQTNAQVQAMIQQQLSAAGPNSMAIFQQNLQQAQTALHTLKDRIEKLGGMSSDMEIPDFKPNNQRRKPLWRRFELGSNLQSTKSGMFWPVTTDLAVSLGFRFTDKMVAGFGLAYKFGLGKDFKHIQYSHEGLGLRSYIDWKIKGNFYLSGGYEQNYRQRFDNLGILKSPEHWQQSGLIGVSRKFPVNRKLKADIKLLFDFLYDSHSPPTQPVLFRFGYTF